MRIVPIAEIGKLGAGEVVPAVGGIITEIQQRHTGKNSKGDWSLQNFTLSDGELKIKVLVSGRDPIAQDLLNREVMIACAESKKGLTGIYAEDDEYRGDKTRILKVTPSASIEPVDEAEPPAKPGKPPATATAPKPSAPAPTRPAPASNGEEDEKKVRVGLNRLANLYLHCLEAGRYVRATYEEMHKIEMNNEQFQGCVSSMFIEANKKGLNAHVKAGKFKD